MGMSKTRAWPLLRPAIVACGMLIAGSALAQSVDSAALDPAIDDPPAARSADDPSAQPDFSVLVEATPELPVRRTPVAPRYGGTAPPATIGNRDEKADGSVALSAGQRLPTPWDAKVGVDLGLAAPAPFAQPNTLSAAGQDHGTGWANVAVPATSLGWDQATIDARVDPSADQGKLSTSLSRSVPVGDGVSLTLKNGYSVTQSLANPNGMSATPGTSRMYSGDGALRLELPTATALSAGATMSSADDRLLPALSAEQKLFGSPLSITGAISQRPTGDADKSIRAGFKRTW
jgi:hypothetical protein